MNNKGNIHYRKIPVTGISLHIMPEEAPVVEPEEELALPCY
jgi:hypothetical protein